MTIDYQLINVISVRFKKELYDIYFGIAFAIKIGE